MVGYPRISDHFRKLLHDFLAKSAQNYAYERDKIKNQKINTL